MLQIHATCTCCKITKVNHYILALMQKSESYISWSPKTSIEYHKTWSLAMNSQQPELLFYIVYTTKGQSNDLEAIACDEG